MLFLTFSTAIFNAAPHLILTSYQVLPYQSIFIFSNLWYSHRTFDAHWYSPISTGLTLTIFFAFLFASNAIAHSDRYFYLSLRWYRSISTLKTLAKIQNPWLLSSISYFNLKALQFLHANSKFSASILELLLSDVDRYLPLASSSNLRWNHSSSAPSYMDFHEAICKINPWECQSFL